MKKLIIIVLTLLLCSALSLNAFADVWIPPTDDGGYCRSLTQLPRSEGAEVLNRLASEFIHEKQGEQNVFAYAEWCEYLGSREYVVGFQLFKTTGDPETCYALRDPKAAENAESVGSCQVQLKYFGDLEATQFDASDFTLTYFRIVDESGNATELLPKQELPAETEAKTVAVTEAETAAEASSVSKTAEVTEANTEKPSSGGLGTTGTIVFTAAVAAAVAAAGVAILLNWKKKR